MTSNLTSGAAEDVDWSSDGRVRRGQKTRARIIAAATRCFAERGFNQTTIRTISDAVGVDKALVIRHFGSKEKLFIACVEAGTRPHQGVQFTDDPQEMVRRVVGIAGPDAPYAFLLACARSAGDEQANAFIREVFEERTVRPASQAHPNDQAMLRTALMAAVSLGLLTTRNILGLQALRELDDHTLTAWLEPIYEYLMQGPAPKAASERG